MSSDFTRKLGLILEQLKISNDEIQQMADNEEPDIERIGQILEETNAMLDKLSITPAAKDDSDV